jgi:hypothetical protein
VIVAAAALLVTGLVTTASYAQPRVLVNSQSLVNPYYRIAPGLPLNQAAYNIRVLGNAYRHIPPWLYGYNPYPSPIFVTPYAAPVYPYYYTPYPTMLYSYPYSAYNPYVTFFYP